MNQQAVNNKTQPTDLNEIRNMIDRLKSQAKTKYAQDKQDIHNMELDESYLRGYYFGQLGALEDCYHLICTLLESVKTAGKQEKAALVQQLKINVSMTEMLISKLETNDNVSEYATSIKDYLVAVKTSLE